jgi:hypothetical protein
MANSERPFKRQDPYEDDVSGRALINESMASSTPSERYFSPVWSLFAVFALLAVIVIVALARDRREQQAQQPAPQTQTVPSTTGSAPAR